MNIGRQWADRLRIWDEAFQKHYVLEKAPLSASFFTTMDRLSPDQAAQRSFSPANPGMKWGCKWEYGWFHATFTVPAAMEGKRLAAFLRFGEEMLVWVNGREAGAVDQKHGYITLTRSARAGETFDLYAECYAGHGVRREEAGIAAWDEITVPEPPECQVTVGTSFVGVWNETVFQAAMDYHTLYSLVKKLPEKSLRAMKIIDGLKKFTYIADFELPEPALTQSVAEAAKVLQPLLRCTNGSTAPEYSVFGQSHLDLAWLWPVEETMRKSARTYSNQLALMEEYPDYLFLMCEPPILEYLRRDYPDLYQRVMEKNGSFLPEGALWVEADTNIPSGESLIRQFVRGKRWFRENTNTESRLAWMPDTFGFSAALPQIMQKCGVPYFATQKLVRQDPECDPFPYNLFWWEGLDGSRVLSHLYKKNNANFDAGDLITRWEVDRIQQENIDGMIYPFGFGDGGGGPTREMLETARRCRDLEGAPRCRMESPVRYFERALENGVENTYCGELYLAWHRGTLTAQSETKRLIRKAEIALKQTEHALSRLMIDGRKIKPEWTVKLESLWHLLLFNQFHDIAPGTSIRRVHERAEQELLSVCDGCAALLSEMLGNGEAVYNPLGWDRLWHGQLLPAQGCAELTKAAGKTVVRKSCGGWELSNGRLTCKITPRGEVESVLWGGREFLRGTGNRLMMFRDVNNYYDAWEVGSITENVPVVLDEEVHSETYADAYGAGVKITRAVHQSAITQIIYLANDAVRLDFITDLDWHERHKLLKVAFPVNVYATEAIHEIQFGHVKRPAHRSRQHDRDQYEVCNHRYTALCDGAGGAAVLNDGKYGVSANGNEIRLTLMRAPLMPDMTADQGMHRFTYSFFPFDGAIEQSSVVREACELNEPPIPCAAMERCEPIFLSQSPNIVIETIKPADTLPDTLLVRAYEAMGMQTSAAFTVHPKVQKVTQTDMLEEHPVACDVRSVSFRAFEIKTFLLTLPKE
ncbi:MAG: alpha-mannosidase [Clostridia bacterium]|nr:alpha-mannosidase [Clostridia bacterium]